MSPERWRQVEQLYRAALEKNPGQRAEFLAHESQGEEELRREVESLLAQNSSPKDVLDRPVWESAVRLYATPGHYQNF